MSRTTKRERPPGADVVIVGAGPAGAMAAIFAARNGASVRLLDVNGRVGKKLSITGKGRCNLTNDCDAGEFMDNLTANGRFLYGAFERLPPREVMRLFEEWGVPLKTERGRRVFPASDDARDVVGALERRLAALGVRAEKCRVTGLRIENGRLLGILGERDGIAGALKIDAGRVIIATGGLSYPATGSAGDGYTLARQAGHTVTPLMPSLSALLSDDPCCPAMQGLTLKNVSLSVLCDGVRVYSEQGEMLFTHEGISGPLVLSASAHMRRHGKYRAVIDLKPALNDGRIDERLLRDMGASPNKDMVNLAAGLLPRLMIPAVLERAGIHEREKANAVTRVRRAALARHIKSFTIDITGLAPIEQAIVTSGGVPVGEIHPKTMCSKLLGGLYFAGEVIDVDAYTGGYNLQIAWCTGAAAGTAAAADRDN
ncbi:MAG: NAD(P)/FAD-dependent oxidoreductase [Oscillospiraceae bacterium]|nr:NAD(P)/FAD-dependent oxidoreductase [Oscillospiraceae bacterium]